MRNIKRIIASAVLLTLFATHAQAEEGAAMSSPATPVEIVAGAALFGTTQMGCYASRDPISISKLMPFVGDKLGDWVNGIKLETKETVNGLAIVMDCAVSPDGLSVTFSAQGYDPSTYSAKWETAPPTTLASAENY